MSDLNVYTTSEINALTPITGDLVVDSDLNAIKLYDGSAWRTFNSDSTAVPFNNEWGATFSSDFLETASDPGLTGIKAVSMWFNTTNTVRGFVISGLGGAAYTTYGGFGMDANNKIYWNDGYSGGVANTSYTPGTWVHFCAVHVSSGYTDTAGTATTSGGGWEMYQNGTRVDLNSGHIAGYTMGQVPVSTTSKFKIGREGERAQYYLNGKIDEVALFTSSLSSSDVSDIYNSGTPVHLGADGLNLNPDIYYRMGDDSNDSPSAGGNITSISDSSGNGHHLTQSTASSQPIFSDLTGESIYA